ncbi:MAG: hypothetical protein JWR38_1624 [Mucilaginibacter sp.]|nr:hypothetical protein [Mucilaginibacter sp.]
MKKCILCFLMSMVMISGSFVASAQYLKDPNGKEYMLQSYTEVEGTPFLINNWAPGSVTLANGQTITTLLKYDLVGDELLFKNKGDSSAMSFVDPVRSFSLNESSIEESDLTSLVFSNGYPAVDKQTPTSFYQVISDGKVKLLKHYKKVIRVDKAFNSATAVKTFFLSEEYYLFVNNQITKIKPGQKAILTVLADKTAQLQKYMSINAMNYKSDDVLAKLFSYYNSLQ